MELFDRVMGLTQEVMQRPTHVGVLSTGEQCAVALTCNRRNFLPDGYTFLDAVDRLDQDWLAACLAVQRQIR